MRLNQFTDIGLRVLMYLAKNERASRVTVAELAAQFSLSHHHLIKVVNQLAKYGWVDATRGRKGGLRLGIDPDRLTLGTMIRQLEAHQHLVDCNKLACSLDGHCRLQGMLEQGLRQFYDFLDRHTLSDMVSDPTGDVLVQMHRQWASGSQG